jgi:hypothetical protein
MNNMQVSTLPMNNLKVSTLLMSSLKVVTLPMNLIHGGHEYLQKKILERIFDIREFILN